MGKHQDHHQARDRHRTGDRHAVGRGEVLRFFEDQHHEDDGAHQRPVHEGDVDLGLHLAGGVGDLQQRHDPGGNPLVDDRKGPADDRLRGDDRRQNREDQERDVEIGGLVLDHAEQEVLRTSGC